MVTVPSTLVPLYLRLSGANRTFITAAGARRRVRERALRPARYGPPARLRPDVRIDVRTEGGWPIYTITPTRSGPVGSVVYVHGGGWVNEIAVQHWQLAAQIAAESATVVSLPIYPLVPFGTAAEVAERVAVLVVENRDRHGPTCLAGDSAGGQIALSSALALRDDGIALPATVLISPAVDLSWSNPRIPEVQPTDPWLGVPGGQVLSDLWRGDRELTDPTVSPLFGEFAGLGPLTVLTGTRDVLNPDAHLLVAKARAAGVEVAFMEIAGQLHVYPLLPTREGARARRAIVEGLHKAVRRR